MVPGVEFNYFSHPGASPPQVGLIPRNYVKELHEVVDSRAPSRGAPANSSAPRPGNPPATNGGTHGDPAHIAQVTES